MDLKEKLPNFIIVGAAKAGTTSLYYYLNQHGEISMSALKEPFFFAYAGEGKVSFQSGDNPKIITTLTDYVDLFDISRKDFRLGESSTWYLYLFKKTIANIKRIYQGQREPVIFILLRNPVARCWSHYLMNVGNGWEEEGLSFREALSKEVIQKRLKKNWAPTYDYLGFGEYYEQVQAYLKNFSNVHIFLFEEFKKNPQKVLKEIFNIIRVNENFLPDTTIRYNFSGQPKNKILHNFLFEDNIIKRVFRPAVNKLNRYKFVDDLVLKIRSKNSQKIALDPELKKELQKYYQKDVEKLQELINQDLSNWLI